LRGNFIKNSVTEQCLQIPEKVGIALTCLFSHAVSLMLFEYLFWLVGASGEIWEAPEHDKTQVNFLKWCFCSIN